LLYCYCPFPFYVTLSFPPLHSDIKTMSGGGGSARVPIPSHCHKIIRNIREITGKQHSDDDIYAVLTECSMDPDETAQKLLYLDTFHEVRRRRDRKKESLSSWASVDSKPKQGGQGRGGRGASGGYSSNFTDGSGGRNAVNRKEIGVNHVAERGHAPSTQPASQKTKSNGASHITRVSAVAPSPANQCNGSASQGLAGQLLMGSVNGSPALDVTAKRENTQPHAVVDAVSPPVQTFKSVTRTDQGKPNSSSNQLPISASSVPSVHSSSDSVLAPSISKNPVIHSANDGKVGGQSLANGLNHLNGNEVVPHVFGELPASESERSGSLNLTNNTKTPNKSNEAEENQLSEAAQSSSPSYNGSMRSSSCGSQAHPEVSTSEVCMQSSDELRQHVIVTFPNHFQVPEALKSGLIFGSFDSDFDKKEMFSTTGGDNNTSSALHPSQGSDKTATSSNQSPSSTAPGDHSDHSRSPSDLIEKPSVSEVNAVSGTEPKAGQLKQEALLAPVATPIPTIMNGQGYGLNFMSTMLGTQQVQFKGAEPQAQETTRPSNYVSANSHSVSSPSPSPSPTPPLQSSLPAAPASVSFFRPPYPPNFFPYGPYYPPIYVSPIHQYLNHNGFPQQPSTGNIYVPAAAAGIKFPLQQLKAGANTGNTTHIGISPGSFISSPVGYSPNQTVNSANLTGNEDLAMSQLKENHVLTTGQLSEGSAVWIPAPGQEISNLQLNSLYNFNHQAHLMYPPTQAAHAFAGIYQPGQTVPSPSTLLQQSQSVTGSVETAGAPSVAYQQPQHAQMNWSSNF
ncbi:GBF-interacting protein 1-like, partial [Neltuma alba]|uniref:GBF-interacting protein 1-like n=1 Tax=Neltuma alba TaxID=207710 RepID=UPI0010A2AB39